MWELKKLGDICENLDSKRVPITKAKRVSGEYPYYGASGIVDSVADYLFDEELLLVSEDGANLLARTYPIAFSVYGKCWVNNHAHVLRFKSQTTQRFIELYLNSISLAPYVSGMAQPKLNQRSLNSIPVPFPEIEVQAQLVSKLDATFADINKAKQNAEQNLKNASELFDSYLQNVFSKTGDTWTENSLLEITVKIGSGATPRGGKAAYKLEGMSLIRSMNVHDREFRTKDLALIDDEQAKKLKNVEVETKDVLLNITGASIARCCVVPDSYLPARVNQHVSIIRVDQNIIRPDFLCFLLTSKFYKDILLEVGGAGATREAITKTQLQNFKVSFPCSLEEQDALLARLKDMETKVVRLQSIYKMKIEALDELKQSILQKAFSGEL
ncbi:restriction endonuclease subunit S [Vibrio aestuarianus]|uniref:restriction endonuclease subunit S n=1 Tax=Vibrio aestuarianus TaxID=28171 RepID=UPI00237CBAEF|nr:restriction endonuclease subunit S [Vibrio aestuarianus]MDE1237614.1 restriction endonuclease subunit S [Vibrio aestuarianus]